MTEVKKDEHAGHGGAYKIDNKTGECVLTERTAENVEKKPDAPYSKGKKAHAAKKDNQEELKNG